VVGSIPEAMSSVARSALSLAAQPFEMNRCAAPAWTWPATMPGQVEHPTGLAEQPAVISRA
jgi:hypothetical protein